MRLLPRTLFGQIALAAFSVLLLVQLAGLWLLLDDRGRLHDKLLAEYAAQRMGGMAAVLDLAAPAERQSLVRALSVQPTTLSLDVPWLTGPTDTSADAQRFIEEARQQMPRPFDIQMLALESLDPQTFGIPSPGRHAHDTDDRDDTTSARARHGRLFAGTYVAQVRLQDSSVVTFRHLLPKRDTDLPWRLLGLLTLLTLSISALTIWAVRRLTQPLAQFSHAATGLAQNLDQAPLPERGPLEVQQATQAFNAMQRDIRRLLDTRAQALSAVSHDLRLPITRIRLRLETDGTQALRERISYDLDEMDDMIGHTLDFLRAGSDGEAVVAIHLDALLDGVIDDMEELGAHITREGSCQAPITARPHALRRCFANILDNARFYGNGTAHVRVTDLGHAVQITISDDGPGIPLDALDKVFEPYFRLESSRARHTGGTGLGLPIARAIAQAHGGSLSLHSPPGEGLTARVVLPRSS